ncbi:MAG: hypothetical protein ALAOOOJD_03195 [bacterium]|nr:hypothetical protein [bacterium]
MQHCRRDKAMPLRGDESIARWSEWIRNYKGEFHWRPGGVEALAI